MVVPEVSVQEEIQTELQTTLPKVPADAPSTTLPEQAPAQIEDPAADV